MSESIEIKRGLKGVYVDKSSICKVDPEKGEILYYGYSLDDLAIESSFEEVAYLLLHGELPKKTELERFIEGIKKAMVIEDWMVEMAKELPGDVDMMERLRTMVSMYGNMVDGGGFPSREDIVRYAQDLLGKMPIFISLLYRVPNKLEILKPKPELSIAGNLLYMIRGYEPMDWEERGLDMSLILYAEHGLNASTFASIVVASTGSDYYSSIVSGISALRGPLHGYANTAALDQFIEIGGPENVEKWFKENILSRRRRLMGYGHRLYRIEDPRSKHYRNWIIQHMDKFDEEPRRIVETALKLHEVASRSFLAEKGIYPNCDYWSAQMYYALRLPREVYTPIFALSRLVGWTAHIIEYTSDNVLIRPRALYVGPEKRRYIPIEERG